MLYSTIFDTLRIWRYDDDEPTALYLTVHVVCVQYVYTMMMHCVRWCIVYVDALWVSYDTMDDDSVFDKISTIWYFSRFEGFNEFSVFGAILQFEENLMIYRFLCIFGILMNWRVLEV